MILMMSQQIVLRVPVNVNSVIQLTVVASSGDCQIVQ